MGAQHRPIQQAQYLLAQARITDPILFDHFRKGLAAFGDNLAPDLPFTFCEHILIEQVALRQLPATEHVPAWKCVVRPAKSEGPFVSQRMQPRCAPTELRTDRNGYAQADQALVALWQLVGKRVA